MQRGALVAEDYDVGRFESARSVVSTLSVDEWISSCSPPLFDDDEIMRALLLLECGFVAKKLGREASSVSDLKSFATEHHPDWVYLLLRKVAAEEDTVSAEEISDHFSELAEFEPKPPPSSESPQSLLRGTFLLRSVEGYPGATGRIVYGDVMAVCVRFDDGTLMSSYSGPYVVDPEGLVVTHYARAGFTSSRMKKVNPAAGKRGGSFAPRRRAFELSNDQLTITTIGGSTRTTLVFSLHK